MKINFMSVIFSFIFVTANTRGEDGYCHTEFGDGIYKCLQEGRFQSRSFQECCSHGNATGYTSATSGIKAIKEFFLRKKQVNCQPCSDYFSKTKKWCFAYRNPSDNYCVHTPSISAIEVASERDCCLRWNANGYTETPRWKWSKGYNRWITQCSTCNKDGFVACFTGYTEDKFRGKQCLNTLPRLAESSRECCLRPNVTAYASIENKGRSISECRPCPVNGGWSIWSPWSPCSATCGDSRKRQIRYCDSPSPKYDGDQCHGSSEKTERCINNQKCPDSVVTALGGRRMTGSWSQWSAFSPCSVTCGKGFMDRRRTCPTVFPDCEGVSHERLPCDAPQPCNIGSVSWIWTEWSPCLQTCGNGVRLRSKLCLIVGQASDNQCATDANVEMNMCDLPPCVSTAESEASEVVIPAPASSKVLQWVIPVVIVIVLGTVIASVIIYRKKHYLRNHNSLRNLKRLNKPFDKRLPSIPPTDPYEGYMSMTIVSQPNSEVDGGHRLVDEDGYEIPSSADQTSISLKKDLMDDSVYDSDNQVNHVYEQLNFYQDKSDCLRAPTDIPDNLEIKAIDEG